ncbi:hypothetical protein [Streptomyces sp. H27-C3]|uniref:hypothetical protein n=1 Tax=Streptomyces sp. H27-C3 TaxID=3046305 RepID=UPI0024B8BB4E|nr:hypothetical protein [Streptomyces sp. H27-C3]MDJ0466212.1 hypothetical protein [Streptomyces sp. H27-C3]
MAVVDIPELIRSDRERYADTTAPQTFQAIFKNPKDRAANFAKGSQEVCVKGRLKPEVVREVLNVRTVQHEEYNRLKQADSCKLVRTRATTAEQPARIAIQRGPHT